MIIELPEDKYYLVKPLIHGRQDINVHLLGVIDRNNRGKIYVDDIECPQTAIIWALGCLFAVIGNNANDKFNQAIYLFLKNLLGPESIELCGGTHFFVPFYEEKWEKTLSDIFAPITANKEFTKCEVLFYTFNAQKYKEMGECKTKLPEGYTIKRVDREIIKNDAKHIIESDILGDFWASTDAFLNLGLGYCLLKENLVISNCFSGYVSDNCHDVSIRTYDKNSRGKGFATLVARAYIDHCLRNGLTPFWCTTGNNYGSMKVADKCGFELYQKRRSFLFPFSIM